MVGRLFLSLLLLILTAAQFHARAEADPERRQSPAEKQKYHAWKCYELAESCRTGNEAHIVANVQPMLAVGSFNAMDAFYNFDTRSADNAAVFAPKNPGEKIVTDGSVVYKLEGGSKSFFDRPDQRHIIASDYYFVFKDGIANGETQGEAAKGKKIVVIKKVGSATKSEKTQKLFIKRFQESYDACAKKGGSLFRWNPKFADGLKSMEHWEGGMAKDSRDRILEISKTHCEQVEGLHTDGKRIPSRSAIPQNDKGTIEAK